MSIINVPGQVDENTKKKKKKYNENGRRNEWLIITSPVNKCVVIHSTLKPDKIFLSWEWFTFLSQQNMNYFNQQTARHDR